MTLHKLSLSFNNIHIGGITHFFKTINFMNTATVIEKKSEIARILFTTENEDIITELFDFANKLISAGHKRPCQYTDNEIIQRIEQSEEQYRNGDVISLEELEKKYL